LETGSGSLTWALETGDFNHDGIDDLLQSTYDGVYLYYGATDGGFATGPGLAGSYLGDIAVGDLNGDGWDDVLVTTDTSIDIELNLHDGGFFDTQIATSADAYQTRIGDFDNDGRPDLVCCTSTGVYVYLDDGGAPNYGSALLLDPPVGFGSESCENIAVGDLNGDGRPDIVSQTATSKLLVRLSQPDGGFMAVPLSTSCNGNVDGRLVIADLNGDGKPDLVCGAACVALRFNVGGGNLGGEISLGCNPVPGFTMTQVVVADFNGDGYPDIAAVGSSGYCQGGAGDTAYYFLNADGGFSPGQPLSNQQQQEFFNGIAALRPTGAALPSLALGNYCDGKLSIFANPFPDGGG
jgi:hypothetical protein